MFRTTIFRSAFPLIFFFAFVSTLPSCQDRATHTTGKSEDNPAPAPADQSTSASPTTSLPAHRSTIRYARGFTIDYFDHYKQVRILNRTGNSTDTLEYLLVPNGARPPSGHPQAQILYTPVTSMIVSSSMHIALAGFCGVEDRITGLASFQYVNSPVTRARIKSGQVKEVGLEGSLNNELVISMHPGLMMAMENPSAGFGKYKVLTSAGIPVLLNAEWLENTPLGRAEWVKLMAALVDKEADVDKKFDSIATIYESLAKRGRNAEPKPHLILGLPFKGTWYMPAGESFMAEYLRDAGATYKWADTKGTGGLPLNFESVAPEALTADCWINLGDVKTKQDIAAADQRFTAFRPFRTGKMYNYDNRVNELGANDYWESGAVHPELILEDLITILHPGLLPPHDLVYYKQIR